MARVVRSPIFQALAQLGKLHDYILMKTLLANGQVLILSGHSFLTRTKFIPFSKSSHEKVPGVGLIDSPVLYHAYAAFTLKSGERFAYPMFTSFYYFPCVVWLNQFHTFPCPNGMVGYFGEWFNSVGRRHVFSKIPV